MTETTATMIDPSGRPGDRSLLAKITAAAIAIVLVLFGGTFLLLQWSMRNIDQGSAARQSSIARHVIDQLRQRIAHDQESVTVWEDAKRAAENHADPQSLEWIDTNIGSWTVSYFGHDASIVVSTEGEPVYTFIDGQNTGVAGFEKLGSVIEPMLATLRNQLRNRYPDVIGERMRTPGLSDFEMINGHPAIVSVKPIVSGGDGVEQIAAAQYMHVAVRYIDGDFLKELSTDYRLFNLSFAVMLPPLHDLAAMPITSGNGRTIGHFVWQPYRPGMQFMASVTPGMLIIGAAVAALFVLAGIQLYRRIMVGRQQEVRIRHVEEHDALTGLFNRSTFETRLDAMLETHLAEGGRMAMLHLDIDRFKQINDTMGHRAGDAVIRATTARLLDVFPKDALYCRSGGDEFNIAMAYEDVSEVENACIALLSVIRAPIEIGNDQTSIALSIGVALAPLDGVQRADLARKAEVALHSARKNGRGTYAMFGIDMDALIRERAENERDLRAALDDKQQFQVLYQPKFRATTGEIASVEALVRWNHPSRGLISPALFIPVTEETGMVRELGRFVMEQACRDAIAWSLDHVAVNISVVQLRDPFFAMTVISVLGTTGLDPRKLELEVTETVWADRPDECQRNIETLRRIGVRIALDDFGTGFSTFGRLAATEVDRLKIDRVFIDRLGRHEGDEAVVRAIIEVARAKGLETTAEGVETEAQRDFLIQAGCDELQGYLLSKPVTASEISRLLAVQAAAGPFRHSA